MMQFNFVSGLRPELKFGVWMGIQSQFCVRRFPAPFLRISLESELHIEYDVSQQEAHVRIYVAAFICVYMGYDLTCLHALYSPVYGN